MTKFEKWIVSSYRNDQGMKFLASISTSHLDLELGQSHGPVFGIGQDAIAHLCSFLAKMGKNISLTATKKYITKSSVTQSIFERLRGMANYDNKNGYVNRLLNFTVYIAT